MQRIGRAFYCQTPNKWFPIEPHLGTLFLHWFPKLLDHYFVLRYLTLWGLMHKPDRNTARIAARDARLLTKSELRRLFPEASIVTERIALLPKSYIAMRLPRPESPRAVFAGARSGADYRPGHNESSGNDIATGR
jgi:hypothetical protein